MLIDVNENSQLLLQILSKLVIVQSSSFFNATGSCFQ